MTLRTVTGVVLWLVFSFQAWAGFDDGLDAYRSGNYERAIDVWLPLATAGNARAQNNVAYMYAHGLGVKEDPKASLSRYSLAAEQGHATAGYNLGQVYSRGDGVLPNQEKATKWFLKSAESGHLKAQIIYAERLRDGVGTAEDLSAAYAWLVVATERAEGKQSTRISSTLARLVRRMSGTEIAKSATLVKRLKSWINEASAGAKRAVNK